MKRTVLLLCLVSAFNVFADDITVNVSKKTSLKNSEQAALEAGLKIEATVGTKKFRDRGAENFNCEFGADATYSKKNITVQKMYINGEAKYQASVNATMTCEEEYDM